MAADTPKVRASIPDSIPRVTRCSEPNGPWRDHLETNQQKPLFLVTCINVGFFLPCDQGLDGQGGGHGFQDHSRSLRCGPRSRQAARPCGRNGRALLGTPGRRACATASPGLRVLRRRRRHGCAVRELRLGPQGGGRLSHEWRLADGYIDAVLASQARYADLLVVGQADPDAPTSTPTDLPEVVALSAGRPCLVVPRAGAERTPGTNILLCWNASRESARAAADALPLLRGSKNVTILVVDPRSSPDGHGAEPGADVAAWLARHGVAVTVQREVAADNDVGGVILSRASDVDADLIVMGLYGHGRMREMILGGTSQAVLARTTVPLFVSH